MIQKLKNGNYIHSLKLENNELDLKNQEVLGTFEIEILEKNYGTFMEDVSLKFNIDCLDFKINNKAMDFYSLDKKSQNEITKYLINKTEKEFNKYLFNN